MVKNLNMIEKKILGINLNEDTQLNLLKEFEIFYNEIPFKDQKIESLRYNFINDWYSYCDAIFLYSMIRYSKPKKIIEVGSGFSSAVSMDTNDLFFNSEINLEFIEPSPSRLIGLMNENDKSKYKIHQTKVEDLPTEIFESLESGDILFIDSSHKFSYGNDLYYLFFKVIPKLKKGVLIHFHDILFPFEYSKEAIDSKITWDEIYFLKNFLMFNESFEIKIFSDFISKFHKNKLEKLPLCLKNTGGNIWIEKIN
jgi:hypothetical protein